MSIDSWLVDTISVAAATGVGNDGDPTFGTATEVVARVETERKRWYNGRGGIGDEIESNHYIATLTRINWDDKIWLPDEDPDTDEGHRPIVLEKTYNKDSSMTLYEVYL